MSKQVLLSRAQILEHANVSRQFFSNGHAVRAYRSLIAGRPEFLGNITSVVGELIAMEETPGQVVTQRSGCDFKVKRTRYEVKSLRDPNRTFLLTTGTYGSRPCAYPLADQFCFVRLVHIESWKRRALFVHYYFVAMSKDDLLSILAAVKKRKRRIPIFGGFLKLGLTDLGFPRKRRFVGSPGEENGVCALDHKA